jgi:hypothetical protein
MLNVGLVVSPLHLDHLLPTVTSAARRQHSEKANLRVAFSAWSERNLHPFFS